MEDETTDEQPFVSTLNHAAADPFRLLVEAVKDYGIYMLDPAGNVSSWNPGAEKSKGYKAEEIIGHHFSCFYTAEDVAADRPQQGLKIALEQGRFEEEGLRLRKGGLPFWAIVTITNIHDSLGRHIGFANVTRDITERKKAEATLRASTETFRLLVEGVKDYGIYMLDPAGNILSWNPGAENIQGYQAEEIIGQHNSCFYPPEDVADGKPQRELERAATGGRVDEEGWRIRKGGDRFWANGVLTALYDDQGKVRGFAKVTRDLTEKRKSEAVYRILVEGVKDFAIYMLDPTGHVSTWNAGAERFMQYRAEEIIGQHFSVFYPAQDVSDGKPERELEEAKRTGRYEEQGWRIRKDGSRNWTMVLTTALYDDIGQLHGFANVTRDISEWKLAQDELLLRDRAIASFTQAVCITDPTQPGNLIIYVNDSFMRITGYTREEAVGRNCRFLQGPNSAPESVEQIRSAIREGRSCLVELVNYRKDGTPFWNALSISPIHDVEGRLTHFVGVQTDISPFKQMERQFQQAQKMEAVGQLAGGVAHDFNNLLTVISGYSELLLGILPSNDPKREAIKAISEAGERAAGLTRQLLFFSRQAVLEAKVLDLNEVVKETVNLLRRMLGEDILLTTVLDPHLSRIKVDPGHVGQILMNLAVNARDAMPQGGKFTVETSNVHLNESDAAQNSEWRPGRYVKMTVSDNGCGMTPEVQARIFEPFFTTKGPGKGTGLGLATVHGIVKQNAGNINLYSEPGHGTVFKLYFPVADAPLHPSAHDQYATQVTGGTETVLLVEDEDAVRAIALLALQTQGYTVLHTDSGKKAVGISEKHRGRIDLLVTDVVMPGMSGRELADALCLQRPGLKVLYLSGYTDDAVIRHGILQAEVAFLQKPYTPLSLARKVREVLDKKV